MVTITINRRASTNRIFSYIVNGHSDDLICNSVSVLTQSPIMGMEWLGYKPYRIIIRNKGFLEVWADGEIDERVQTLLETMLLGLQSLERQYPNVVKIKTETSVVLW